MASPALLSLQISVNADMLCKISRAAFVLRNLRNKETLGMPRPGDFETPDLFQLRRLHVRHLSTQWTM